MSKEAMFNKITNYGLYLLVFLTPFFFLPYTHLPVLANKQLLVAVLSGLLLLVWLVKIMATGKARFRWDKLTIAVLVLVLVLAISTFLSLSKQQSFWGAAFEPDTLVSFILYSLVFLLLSNLVESKMEALRVIKAFLAGCGVLAALFLIQVLFGAIFPWEFAKTAGFNPVGTVPALGIMLAGALLIAAVLVPAALKSIKKRRSPIGLVGLTGLIFIGVLALSCVVLINHWAVWVTMGLGCVLLIWIKGFNKEAVIPVCLLVLSLLFVVLHIPSDRLAGLPGEVVLSYKASFNIAKETLFQGVGRFLFGSGPGTFAQDYDLFRPLGINLTDFWQVRFTQGIAVALTLLATSGVLGFVCLLFLMATFFWHGFKAVLIGGVRENAPTTPTTPTSLTSLTIFVGGFYFLLSWFFYSFNFGLMFFGFLLLGLWTAIQPGGKSKEFELRNMQPQHSFFIMLLCIVLLVGVVAGLYRVSENYAGALFFSRGVEFTRGPESNIDQAIAALKKAAEISQNDSYFRGLAQAFLLKLSQVQASGPASEAKRAALQELINQCESAGIKATQVCPLNSQNWLLLSGVYEYLADLGVSKAGDSAIAAYETAKGLSPRDPLIRFKLAFLYNKGVDEIRQKIAAAKAPGEWGSEVEILKAQGRQKIEAGLQEIQKAIELKQNFPEALQLVPQIQERSGWFK